MAELRVRVVGPAVNRELADFYLRESLGCATVEERADVLLLSCDRPEWLDWLQAERERSETIPAALLTFGDPDPLKRGLQMGVGAFISREELPAAWEIGLFRASRGITFVSAGLREAIALAQRELAAAAVVSVRRPRREQKAMTALETLSPRELEIAIHAAAGLRNAAIGKQLFCSLPTVKTHLYRVFFKLQVRCRSELIHILSQDPDASQGILKVPKPGA